MSLEFKNEDRLLGSLSFQKKRLFPPRRTAAAMTLSFFLSFALLRAGKAWLLYKRPAGEAARSKAAGSPGFSAGRKASRSASRAGAAKARGISLPPLLVNLKGAGGPRLAHVHVEIKIRAPEAKKELLSDRKKLSKYLLFALSGKSIKDLAAKKSHFESRIQSQLNAFLPAGPAFQGAVEGVSIRAKALN